MTYATLTTHPADGLLILHREDKFPTAKDNVENPAIAGLVDVLAPKLRGVADNTYSRLRFRGEVQRFEDVDTQPDHPAPLAARWRDPDEDLDDPTLRSAHTAPWMTRGGDAE